VLEIEISAEISGIVTEKLVRKIRRVEETSTVTRRRRSIREDRGVVCGEVLVDKLIE